MLDDPNPTAWEVAGLRTVDSPDLHTNSGPETPLLEFIAGSPLSLQSTPSPHEPGPLMLTPMADDGQYARWHITGALSFMGMLELERAIATQPGVSAAHIRPRDNGAEIAVDCRDVARTLQTLLELPSFTITLAQD
jgi:hypothetical protein